MYGFIFGFHRLARWPKCTPASIMSLTAIATRPTSPRSPLAHSRPRPAGRHARGGRARRTDSEPGTEGCQCTRPPIAASNPRFRRGAALDAVSAQTKGRPQVAGGPRSSRRPGTGSAARLAQVHLEVAEVDVAVMVVVVEVL